MENLLSENMQVEKGEIVVYQPDEITKLEVRVRDETVWLTQELEEISVCSILELTAADGKKYMTQLYNLDMILSIGASLKDLGKKWFGFTLMEHTGPKLLLSRI